MQGSTRPVGGWFTGNGLDQAEAGNNRIVELNITSDNIDHAGVRHDASTDDWMW